MPLSNDPRLPILSRSAETVEHIEGLNLLIVGLSNRRKARTSSRCGARIWKNTPRQLQNYELLGCGTDINFLDVDIDLYVPAPIEGVYENRRWMAHSVARAAKPPAQQRLDHRANGANGGRPKHD